MDKQESAIGENGGAVAVRGLVIILAGPIATDIYSSGASGIPGGIIRALVDSGFSKASSILYETGIKKEISLLVFNFKMRKILNT